MSRTRKEETQKSKEWNKNATCHTIDLLINATKQGEKREMKNVSRVIKDLRC